MTTLSTDPVVNDAIFRIGALPAAGRDAAIDAFLDSYNASVAPRWIDGAWFFVRVEYAAAGLLRLAA